ncbi:MAG TPA: group II intron reverse transcriptase/maturase [Candidatus Sulfotelmatobacter sp.]|nr:group II intron reverse transcriptase/maturase [Candidatus Sulfotelmatobacter sp.]
MSLATPRKIQELQRKLYSKAKQEPNYRFYSLYDKIHREDILAHAYALAKANHGAPGVDEQSFEEIESRGRGEWLAGLQEALCHRTYQPQAVRRVMIPKPHGEGERPLGIPTIRDRVAQTAAKLVLEPILEADLEPNAYAYRPQRSAQQAVQAVHELLMEGYTDVVDADLSKYFDTIPHSELLQSVAQRIADGGVLHLLKMWLTSPVEERDEKGNRTMTGGQSKGTPQGGVVSPLLANLYMNRFLKHWRGQGKGRQYRAHIVNYADDFVILSRGKAAEAREWTQAVLTRIGLTLNEQKTCIRNATKESFDFLGYTFGPRYWWKTRRWYCGAGPSRKALQKLKKGVYEMLRPGEIRRWEEVCVDLNAKLRGWQTYFRYGSLRQAYRIVDSYVYNCVRHFLRRRHKATNSRGTRQFSDAVVYGKLGVHRLQRT